MNTTNPQLPQPRPVRTPRLRIWLTFWVVVVSMVIQSTLGLMLLLYHARSVKAQVDSELSYTTGKVVALLGSQAEPLTDAWFGRETESIRRSAMFERWAVAVIGEDGAVLASTVRPAVLPDADSISSAIKTRAVVRLKDNPELERDGNGRRLSLVSAAPVRLEGGLPARVVVMSSDGLAAATGSLARTSAVAAVCLSGLATGIAVWVMTGLAFAHLRELPGLASSLSPEGLSQGAPPVAQSKDLAEFETALKQTRLRLKLALSAQDRFVSSASHELKTPIAVLLAEAQTIDRAGIGEDGRSFVTSVVDEMRQLGQTVDDFLTLTRLRSGRIHGSPSLVSLRDTVCEAIGGTKAAAVRQRVSIAASFVAEEDEPTVVGDPALLRTMFEKVLANGLRFSPPDSVLAINVKRESNAGVVEFLDRGIAVPLECVGRLQDISDLDGGAQSKGRQRTVGLAIATAIAELHGGSIEASTPVEGGCLFSIRLPHAPSEGPEIPGKVLLGHEVTHVP